MILPRLIIELKRDKKELTPDQINDFVRGVVSGSVDQAHIAALCMAIYLNGLTISETVALTKAFAKSGDILEWSALDLDGPVLDKHSSGGVGDKVTFILCPLIAACGGYMGKMSGRGLGHTGGTADKIEAIPGYQVNASLDQYFKTVKDVGCAIITQTAHLAPADKKFYAVRDITATVSHVGLITASIVSKKLAIHSQGFLADIKVGSGALMKTISGARKLAHSIQEIATKAGLPTRAMITDMNQVLGHSAGNAVEVVEALDFLTGVSRDARLEELILSLGAQLLLLGNLETDAERARVLLKQKLDNGAAAEKFALMTAAMGGPTDLLETYLNKIVCAKNVVKVYASKSGYISAVNTRKIGQLIVEMGGGRQHTDDQVDHGVGVTDILGVGDVVERDQQPLATLYLNDNQDTDYFKTEIAACFNIQDDPISKTSIVYDLIG